MENEPVSELDSYDTNTKKEFYNYYAAESLSDSTQERAILIKDAIIRMLSEIPMPVESLDVLDVGCGAGSVCAIWEELGHKAHGIDINNPLIELAKKRSSENDLKIDFKTGSATKLPWGNETMDVCMAPELLEHVADWKACLDEFSRVLRPNGVLYLSTSNKLCPKQQEFTLPLYSWYPAPIKRYYERLAVTTHPEIAGYAKYPAVNWFSYYQLRDELASRGLKASDRFDRIDVTSKGNLEKFLIKMIQNFSLLRWLGHVVTPYTSVIAVKIKK